MLGAPSNVSVLPQSACISINVPLSPSVPVSPYLLESLRVPVSPQTYLYPKYASMPPSYVCTSRYVCTLLPVPMVQCTSPWPITPDTEFCVDTDPSRDSFCGQELLGS